MLRLLEQARRRPLDDALTVRRGENIGQRVANVTDERRADLERLGHERPLIYKTLILTGLRKNELRTLSVGDLSLGDVPLVILRAKNEKKARARPDRYGPTLRRSCGNGRGTGRRASWFLTYQRD